MSTAAWGGPAAETAPPALQRVRGEASVVTQLRDGRTRIATLFQEGAAKVRLPLTHDRSLQAVLMNTAGGLTGGDRLSWTARAAPETHLVLTTPACERIYRSARETATVETRLSAAPGARLDWLPQETILFEDAHLTRRLEIDMAPDATLLAVEAVILGRQAMGENALRARLRDDWRVRRGDRLVHAEATRLAGDPRERESLSLLAGHTAFATILYVADDAEARLDGIRGLVAAPDAGTIGASAVGERLAVRALASSGLALRRLIVPIIAMLSPAGSLPRLWYS
ncbi:MAG: urease accessory protein UreD [Devosia sp.]